ncbi:MAG: hypothetical protein K1X89_21120 [Myxococcaceae bacterium]|nr:hypothetical protein [Myxococcaceae bacterium]
MRAALLLGVLLVGACSPPPPAARAFRIESIDQAIGGPVATGKPGDFLLENGLIRAVVEQGGASRLPLDIGGSLVDLDVVRPEAQYRGGHGLDLLGQLSPVVNLAQARALGPKSVRITSSNGVAEVTTSGEAVAIQRILDALNLLIRRDFAGDVDHAKFRLYTEYRLAPGERVVSMRTTVGFDVPFCAPQDGDGCNAECDDINYDADCSCPAIPARCGTSKAVDASAFPDRPEPVGLSDVLLGDLPRPVGTGRCLVAADCDAAKSEDCVDITTGLGGTSKVCRGPMARDPGAFFGDMLLFGGHLSPFLPGVGFDTESDIRRLFDSGVDTLSYPLAPEVVFAIGDRVSYAYGPRSGTVLVPVFGGPFSLGATGAVSCPHATPGCLAGKVMRSERFVAVGQGDVSSAFEPLAKVKGVSLGEVKGTVRASHTPKAVSDAEIYALSDPRALACDAACLKRCGALDGLTDAQLSEKSLDELIALNRCRTPSTIFLAGVAGIVSQTRTDLGTDPVKDGDFRLALPEGRYVLVAQRLLKARSSLVPVTVTAGKTTRTALELPEPGKLLWEATDEAGKGVPAKLSIGRCLPGDACGPGQPCGDGQQCVAGSCACARGSGWPLELGGPRLADGLMAFDESVSGKGALELAPGEYDFVLSHGPFVGVNRQHVTVASNQSVQVRGALPRRVFHPGWTAADFHVHAEHSIDSGLAMQKRAESFIVEDMEFLSSSDHDVLSDYEPLLEKLGWRTRLGTQVGAEVTTQELGHFIGWPLNYQRFTAEAEPKPVLSNGAPEWREKTPGQIFQAMRAAGKPGATMVVEVPHPYSYFDYYGLDAVTVEPADSILAVLGINPLIQGKNFSGDFEAMELCNGKNMDQVRRPTVDEVRFYSQGMDALLAERATGTIDDATYAAQAYELATEAARRILHRTPEEQRAALSGLDNELGCKCGSDGDCSGGNVCDQETLSCVKTRGTGAPAPGAGLCKALRGVVDDWFAMLNHGVRRTGVGGSDTHALYGFDGTGTPRTMIRTPGTSAPYVHEEEIAQGVLKGQVQVTNGPLMSLTVAGGGLGDVVKQAAGPVKLELKVEKGDWFDVDRIEVYRNGELIHWVTGCASRRPGDALDGHDHGCLSPGNQTVAFDGTFTDAPTRDAWYVVIAMGLDGRSLAGPYGSSVLPRLGTFEIAQKVYDIVPTLSTLRTPRFPSLYPAFPLAITNPVWVDLGGDGWTPPQPPPSWCVPGKDFGCAAK